MYLKKRNIYLFFLLLTFVMLISSCSATQPITSPSDYESVSKEDAKFTKDEKALIKEAKSWIGT